MIFHWRGALAASLICFSSQAAAREREANQPESAPAGRADRAGDGDQAVAGEVHDGATPPAAAAEEPAIDLSVVYTAEVLRNTRGGLGLGTRYLDNLDITLTVDAERAFGWRGATLFAYALYNNGEPFSDDLVGAAQGVSNIETGVAAARLYEAWIEQRFAGDRASVKVGLYDLNSEFDSIGAAALFLNPSHGIGPDFSQSGRNGPSIFPVTSLAIRGDYQWNDRWLVRAAILDGVPGDPDRPERTVIHLSESDGALMAVELNYLDERTKAAIGYWRYTGSFDTLAAPASSGDQPQSSGNEGLYAFVERRLTSGGENDEQGLAGWIRFGLANERLNPIRAYAGGGLTYTGPFRGRDEDQIGVALGVAEFGEPFRRGSGLAADALEAREVIAEATYRAPLNHWLTVQPDVQYVVNPGGRPEVADALVLGLRAEIGF